MSHPIGILFAGLFIAHLTVGGFNIQLYNFVPEVIDMIISVIIYCGAFALLFKQIINKMFIKTDDEKKPVGNSVNSQPGNGDLNDQNSSHELIEKTDNEEAL